MSYTKKFGLLASLVLVSAFSPQGVSAQAYVWNGRNGNIWDDDANWGQTSGIPNAPDAAAIFVGQTGNTIDLNGKAFEINQLIVWDQDRRFEHGGLIFRGVDSTIDTSAAVTLAGTTRAENQVVLQGGGSLSVDHFLGDIRVDLGTIRLGADGTKGIISGTVELRGAADLEVSNSQDAVSVGALNGEGNLLFDANAELVVGGNGDSSAYSGQMGTRAGGQGLLRKVGEEALRFDTFAFLDKVDVAVDAGTLIADGILYNGMVTIGAGARLEGSGYLAKASIGAGGTLAPSGSAGTILTIMGDSDTQTTDLSLADGSIYEVGISASGSTSTVVDGKAEVGAAKVRLRSTAGPNLAPGIYEILTATDGIVVSNGGFISPSAFLSIDFDYSDQTKVLMELTGDTLPFSSAAVTGNQASVANAIQTLDSNGAIYQAVLYAPTLEDARFAFDNLSGESHATAMNAFANLTGHSRKAAIRRLADMPSNVKSFLDTGEGGQEIAAPGKAVWGSFYGEAFSLGGNFASTGSSGGATLGLDGVLGDWRIGMMLNAGQTRVNTAGTGTVVNSGDYGVGFYAGTEIEGFGIKVGTNHTYHDVTSSRAITVPGLETMVSAAYGAFTSSAFVEVSHAYDLGKVVLEPYLGVELLHQARNGFVEQGGVAALAVTADTSWSAFGILGLRGSTQILADGDFELSLDGGIAYRAGATEAATLDASFAGGGGGFVSEGSPYPQNAVLVDVGIGATIGSGVDASVRYGGSLGHYNASHGIEGRLAVKF